MEKIIIENRTDLPWTEILPYIEFVIKEGRISKTGKGEQYCFLTTWTHGIGIACSKNKCSDRFVVFEK